MTPEELRQAAMFDIGYLVPMGPAKLTAESAQIVQLISTPFVLNTIYFRTSREPAKRP